MNHKLDEQSVTFGLLACGSAGSWSVDLDESADGTEWLLTLDGPNVYLAFAPLGLESVRAACEYLRVQRPAPLALGHFDSVPVRLHWDDEHADRCFLIVGPRAHATFRVTLTATDAGHLADALGQVLEELPAE